MTSKATRYLHSKSGYYFESCDSDTFWDSELAASPQDNIFLRSSYMRASGLDKHRYFIKLNDDIVGGITLVPKVNRIQLNYATYQGLWLKKANISNYRDDLKILESIQNVAEIIEFNKIETNLSLHWSLIDMRGFEWAFLNSNNMSINFKPRYTGILDLTDPQGLAGILLRMRKVRQQEFNRNYNLTINDDFNDRVLEEFLGLYSETLRLTSNAQDLLLLNRVAELTTSSIRANTGQLFSARGSDRQPLAFILLQDDGNVGYYQFAARSRTAANIPATSKLVFTIIQELISKNRSSLDFVGMNSPARGEYKASFNARPGLYFDVATKNKSQS